MNQETQVEASTPPVKPHVQGIFSDDIIRQNSQSNKYRALDNPHISKSFDKRNINYLEMQRKRRGDIKKMEPFLLSKTQDQTFEAMSMSFQQPLLIDQYSFRNDDTSHNFILRTSCKSLNRYEKFRRNLKNQVLNQTLDIQSQDNTIQSRQQSLHNSTKESLNKNKGFKEFKTSKDIDEIQKWIDSQEMQIEKKKQEQSQEDIEVTIIQQYSIYYSSFKEILKLIPNNMPEHQSVLLRVMNGFKKSFLLFQHKIKYLKKQNEEAIHKIRDDQEELMAKFEDYKKKNDLNEYFTQNLDDTTRQRVLKQIDELLHTETQNNLIDLSLIESYKFSESTRHLNDINDDFEVCVKDRLGFYMAQIDQDQATKNQNHLPILTFRNQLDQKLHNNYSQAVNQTAKKIAARLLAQFKKETNEMATQTITYDEFLHQFDYQIKLLEKQLDSKVEEREQIKKDVDRMNHKLGKLSKEKKNLLSEVEEVQKSLVGQKNQQKTLLDEIFELKQNLKANLKKNAKLEEILNAKDIKIKSMTESLTQAKKDLNQEQTRQESVQRQLNSLLSKQDQMSIISDTQDHKNNQNMRISDSNLDDILHKIPEIRSKIYEAQSSFFEEKSPKNKNSSILSLEKNVRGSQQNQSPKAQSPLSNFQATTSPYQASTSPNLIKLIPSYQPQSIQQQLQIQKLEEIKAQASSQFNAIPEIPSNQKLNQSIGEISNLSKGSQEQIKTNIAGLKGQLQPKLNGSEQSKESKQEEQGKNNQPKQDNKSQSTQKNIGMQSQQNQISKRSPSKNNPIFDKEDTRFDTNFADEQSPQVLESAQSFQQNLKPQNRTFGSSKKYTVPMTMTNQSVSPQYFNPIYADQKIVQFRKQAQYKETKEREVQTEKLQEKVDKNKKWDECCQTESGQYINYMSDLFLNELKGQLKDEISEHEYTQLKLLLERSRHIIEKIKSKSSSNSLKYIAFEKTPSTKYMKQANSEVKSKHFMMNESSPSIKAQKKKRGRNVMGVGDDIDLIDQSVVQEKAEIEQYAYKVISKFAVGGSPVN